MARCTGGFCALTVVGGIALLQSMQRMFGTRSAKRTGLRSATVSARMANAREFNRLCLKNPLTFPLEVRKMSAGHPQEIQRKMLLTEQRIIYPLYPPLCPVDKEERRCRNDSAKRPVRIATETVTPSRIHRRLDSPNRGSRGSQRSERAGSGWSTTGDRARMNPNAERPLTCSNSAQQKGRRSGQSLSHLFQHPP